MEFVSCALCGGNHFEPVFQSKDINLKTSNQLFQVVRCLRCGLMYTNPRSSPSEMPRYYPPEYAPHHQGTRNQKSERSLRFHGLLKHMEKRCLEKYRCKNRRNLGWLDILFGFLFCPTWYSYLPPYVPEGRLLDIGCGSGSFLSHAVIAGWKGVGLDFSINALVNARSHFGLNVFKALLPQIGLRDKTFDAVTMYMVLEHTHHPMETLQEIRRILKPGGILILSVPDASSIEVKIFGPRWYSWDLPRHLYHFTPSTLKCMLRKTGFHVIRLWHERNILNLRGNLRHVLYDNRVATLGRVFCLPRPLRLWLWRFFGLIWGSIGQSGRMVAIARLA